MVSPFAFAISSRENLEFGRRTAQHQVRRLGNAVVGDVRVAVHLAVGTVHSHLERHDNVGILREHGSELFHMTHYPLVFGSHITASVVPRIVTDAHNRKAIVRTDIVKRRLQHVQRVFGQVLAHAAHRIALPAGSINRKPCVAAEFRNFGTQVEEFRPWFFNRLAARRLEVQHLRRIEPTVKIVKRRHRIGRVNRLFYETSRKKRGLQECDTDYKQKTDMDSSHIRNIYFFLGK